MCVVFSRILLPLFLSVYVYRCSCDEIINGAIKDDLFHDMPSTCKIDNWGISQFLACHMPIITSPMSRLAGLPYKQQETPWFRDFENEIRIPCK